MEMTGKQLHEIIEEYVPGFDDADLFHQGTIEICDDFESQIRRNIKNNFISIDGPDGHERLYFEIESASK